MTTDPMEPVKKLMQRLTEEVRPLGLEVHTFALLPNPDGPPHAVQAVFMFSGEGMEDPKALDGDIQLTDEERDVFEMLERDVTRSTEQEKADEAAAAAAKLLKDLEGGTSGGILGDD
jgi:hypothetical protein